jgi:heat-inducible transcriptional repressor
VEIASEFPPVAEGRIAGRLLMDLSKRALSVLCAVVEIYIRSGEPVASRQVARRSGFSLSPATIRNVMAELEEGGFLSRAHPSAGSVPSDLGFRRFVDTMPRRRTPSASVRRDLTVRMAVMRRELVEDIEWVARLIAESTHEAGVAVRPMGEGAVLQAVSLVLLEGGRVLGVVVADDGTVEKRVVELNRDHTRIELQTLANFLTRTFAEVCLAAHEVAQQLFSTEKSDVEVRVAGADSLVATADFSEVDRVRSLLATLQDRPRIAHEFRRALTRGPTQILIGEESEATASGRLGMVATLYFKNGRRAGAVGVFGPRRMDYQRIVPMVEFIGDTLTQMLETPGASHACRKRPCRGRRKTRQRNRNRVHRR